MRAIPSGTTALAMLGVLGLLALGMTGCLGKEGGSGSGEMRERVRGATSTGRTAEAGNSGLVGIRTQWWVVTDDVAREAGREPLAAVLAPFESAASPISAATRELWRRNGLRIVAVPRDEIEGIRSRLLFAGPSQEQTHGQLFSWSPLAVGASWQGEARLLLDNGPLELPAGRLRLIARCWVVPGKPAPGVAGVPARLNLELVPQHEELRRNRDLFEAAARARDTVGGEVVSGETVPDLATGELRWREPGAAKDLREDGLVFSRLALSAELDGSACLIIVAELPNSDWSSLRTPAEPDATRPGGAAEGESDAEDDAGQTTMAPALSTIGEAMLTDRFSATGGRRLVVVLEPGVPDRFRLMGQ